MITSNGAANNVDQDGTFTFISRNSAPSGGDKEHGLQPPSNRGVELVPRASERSEDQADTARVGKDQLQLNSHGDGPSPSGRSEDQADTAGGSRDQLQLHDDRGDGSGATGRSEAEADAYAGRGRSYHDCGDSYSVTEVNKYAGRGDRQHISDYPFGPKPSGNEQDDVTGMLKKSESVASSDVDVDGNVIDESPQCRLDQVNVSPAGLVDIIFGILGLGLYFLDIGSDIKLTLKYFDNLEFVWGGCTAGFIVIAYIATTLLNIGFYCLDHFKVGDKASSIRWIGRILLSILLSGGAQR